MMKLIKVKQKFERTKIPDEKIEKIVKQQFVDSGVAVKKGSRIAIAVGSRGIANLPRIVKTVVQCVKEMGGEPFIVPAMGSHGGATAEGQKQVLESYRIMEEYVEAPIKSSMEVVELPPGELHNKVYMDKLAYEADGTIVINRVKVHTAFHGAVESGLMKMCVIGLGKHQGALEIHRYGAKGLRELIPPTARQILTHGNIILGIAIAENAYEETAVIKAVQPADFEREDIRLLQWVRDRMPKLPVEQLDVLMIDEFGKNISGTGMDVNIIGRLKIASEPEPESPRITSIILLALSDKSHGNANGMGLADVITHRFFEKIDIKATYENILTTGFLERGKMPIVAATEQQALEYALKPCGIADPEQARLIRIKNTLLLDEIWVSQKVLEEIQGQENIEVTDERNE
jgi:hypothetical protein